MVIVIADNQRRDLVWLQEILTKGLSDLLPLYEATNGLDAVNLCLQHRPELAFLDIDMPALTGIKAAELIVKDLPKTGIIILSNHADEVWVRQLWKVMPPDSAFGYLLKEASDAQVVEAARAVLGGDCVLYPRVQKVIRRLETVSTGLSDGELEVLAYISLGLTDKAIARRLYVTEKAVQCRLKALYQKLSCTSREGVDDQDFNHRCRAMNAAIRRGLINRTQLEEWESALLTPLIR